MAASALSSNKQHADRLAQPRRRFLSAVHWVAAALLVGVWPLASRAADSFTITPPLVANALSSCSDFTLSDGVIDSQNYSATATGGSGNVLSNGNVKVSGGTLNGNATAGPGKAITVSGSGKITGTRTTATSAYNCTPIDLTQLSSTLPTSNDNAKIGLTGAKKDPLGGAAHTDFTLSGGDTLTLAAGTYYFTKFTISGGSTITVTGPIRIFCTGQVSISGGSFVNTNPYNIRFWSSSTSPFGLSGGSSLSGFIYAPSAALTISASRVYGSAMAQTITVSGNSHVTRLIDDVPPQVAITAPANNSAVPDPSHVVVSGTISDDTDVAVQVNGQNATVNADGTWQTTLNLSAATSPATITATATDAGGNVSTAKVSVITIPPPTLTLTLPAPGSYVNSTTVTMSGGAGTATSVTVNGVVATIANGIWTAQNVNVGAEGQRTVMITGSNAGGSATITPPPTLTVDLTKPAITASVSPTPDATGWNKGAVTVTFACSDSLSNVASCSPAVTLGTDGAGQTVTGQAADKAGNTATATVTVNIDSQPPRVAITAPADHASVSADPAHVAVTGTVASLSPATLQVNEHPVSIAADGTWQTTVDLSGATGSTATITASAANASGKASTATISVVTLPPPTLSLTLPSPESFVNTPSLRLSGGSGTATTITVNGSAATISGGVWTIDQFDLGAEGAHTLNIVGTNEGGTSAIHPLLTLDRTLPTITASITPQPNAAGWNPTAVTVRFDCSDALSGIAECSPPVTLTTDAAGQTVTGTATDKARNSASTTVTVNIDTQKPQIAITSPAANAVVSDPAHVVVSGRATAVSPVTVQVNNQPVSVGADGSWQVTLDLSSGNSPATITATATSAVNAAATAQISVITMRPPVLSLTLPAPDSFVNTPVRPLSGGAGNAATVTVNGFPAAVSNGIWTIENFNLGSDEGKKILTVVGTNAGGSNSITPSITLDTTPPSITAAVTPAPKAAGWYDGVVTITFTCSDALSGVLTCPPAATVAADGAGHVVKVEAVDGAKNVGTATVIVNIDTQKPQIAITSPPPNSVATDPAHVVVTGTASAISPVSVQVNGQPATLAADGTWRVTIDVNALRPSAAIIATATNAVGATSSAQVNVITLPRPELSLTLPVPGSFVDSSYVTLSGGAGTATSVTVNGTAATINNGIWTISNFELGGEGAHTLTISGTNIGGTSTISPTLTVDLTRPSITASTTPAPNAAGWNNTPVTVTFACDDALSGVAKCPASSTLNSDGAAQTVVGEAEDNAHNRATTSVTVNIDTITPSFTIDSQRDRDVVPTPQIVVAGRSDDAIVATVNGVTATIDPGTRTFTAPLTLTEGANTIVVTGFDIAGNQGTATITLYLDTRAPQITLNPLPSCTNAATLDVSGRVADDHAGSSVTLTLTPGDATATATVTNGTWAASLPVGEGKFVLTARTEDSTGHSSVVTVPVNVDRTKPVIALSAAGTAFNGGTFRTAQSIDIRAIDADPNAVVTATLNGVAYVPGTPIADGVWNLGVEAHDCAGNSSTAAVAFKVDSAAPVLVSATPADASRVGALPQTMTGTVRDADLQSAVIEGTSATATISGTTFTFASLPLTEGANTLTLVLTDAAGNVTRVPYHLDVKTTTPSVSITERGLPVASGSLFNRPVTMVITSNEPAATITATLDGSNSYPAAGQTISGEGTHTIVATARDAFGHTTTPPVSVSFAIDLQAPRIVITQPADKTVVPAQSVNVTGTITGSDVDSVTVNGVAATIASGTFTATVGLEAGENVIIATASDHAGNTATAQITVTRGSDQPGIILTSPNDKTWTNRPTTTVIGQVLTPGPGVHVTINDAEVPVDAGGVFRKDGYPLVEGTNTITAKIAGTSRSVTVNVFTDLTPPALTVLADGAPLEQGARFATSPVITLQPTDNHQDSLMTRLTIDGAVITGSVPILANGGHALTAVATDVGGNSVRIDRTFSVGSTTGGSGGCSITGLNPDNNAVVRDAGIRISGRTGGAAAILVNGVRAQIESGTFAAGLQLSENANTVKITCADTNGVATGDPKQITIYLFTTDPTITITAPARDASLTSNTVTVRGHASASVVSGDVNGIPFKPGTTGDFEVPNFALNNGLNAIAARGRDALGRSGIATVEVFVSSKAPQITITSPLPATTTGATTIDVSGVWAYALPSSIHVGNASIDVKPLSDTTGTFVATGVPLTAGRTTTITATAQNAAGVTATTSVDVQNASGPSISITSPADNSFYPATAAAPSVAGTVSDLGSTVQVNGVLATVTDKAFAAAAVPFAANGATNYIARVTTSDGGQAIDSIRVVKLPALTVTQSFPAAGATGVDPGLAIVLLFSNPIRKDTIPGTITLADDTGTTVICTPFVDNDSITLAPQVPLSPGRNYTLTVSSALRDLGGNALASPYTLHFSTGTTAPAVKPSLDHGDVTNCITSDTLSGTASVAGARVQLDLDGVTTTTTAGSDRRFSFTLSFAGQPGSHIARVRELGADGSVSPAETVSYRIACNTVAAHVVSALIDRSAKTLTIEFSSAVDSATLVASATGTVQLHPSGAPAFTGTVSLSSAGTIASVLYNAELSASLTLTISGVRTTSGAAVTDYTTTFDAADQQPVGKGYIAGAIYDAATGRPIEGASVVITPGPITRATSANGHYSTQALAEGAYTIEATATGYSKVWRQVVVPAGVGVVPIDIRLTKRAADHVAGADQTITDGGATALTGAVELFVPSAAAPAGTSLTLTSLGAQSLAGLLPLGWSPLASAEVAVNGSASSPVASLAGAKLTFVVGTATANAVAAANQTLSIVQYDSQRDEWRTLVAAAAVTNGRVTADLLTAGNYALVYADITSAVTGLVHPEPAHAGLALQGVPNPCSASAADCAMTQTQFTFNPTVVAPSEKAVATLLTTAAAKYPSGTAVQAYIDEQLNFADGSVRNDAPFATDLLVYRDLTGTTGQAVFGIAPTTAAGSGTLRDGADHVRVVDYPGRVDRGALIGAEGGRVAVDDTMSIDIPSGATNDAIHASATPMAKSDLAAFDNKIPGFHVAGGFTLSLTRTGDIASVDLDGDGKPDTVPVELLSSAHGTFTITSFPTANQQVILAEVLDKSAYGAPLLRLAATTTPSSTVVSGARVFSTNDVNPAVLPVDGIVRNGRYLVLTVDAPVAFAWGHVRVGGVLATNAFVTAGTGSTFEPSLGVIDISRSGATFAIPVAAQPAGPFALRGRTPGTGSGLPSVFNRAAAPDENVAFGDLAITAVPPSTVTIAPNGVQVPVSGFQATATFDVDIDSGSAATSFVVTNLTTSTPVAGRVSTVGRVVTFTPSSSLTAGSNYSITVLPGIRSAAGAPFGQTQVAYFTTESATVANTHVDATKIRITIPVNGVSTVSGSAGALPTGAIALAVRRGRLFVSSFSTEVTSADGSFSMTVGSNIGEDAVSVNDAIDLQVLDKVSRSPIAVIPLTPFVSTDGLGFIAPAGTAVNFYSSIGVNVHVPAGAFDTATLIRVAPSSAGAFAEVPSVSTELKLISAVTLNFDGSAKKPLDVDIAVPPNTPTDGHDFELGRLGDSARGPRVEIDDLLRVDGNFFTTRTAASGSSVKNARISSSRARTSDVLVGGPVRDYLMHVVSSGTYAVTEIATGAAPLAWAATEVLQQGTDLFWSSFHSLYVSQLYITAGHGRVVMPVLSNAPFTVEGVDHNTGITLFTTPYDGIPVGTPGNATGIPALQQNSSGPYPVSGSPFNIQSVTVVAGLEAINSIPGVTVDTAFAANGTSGIAKVFFNTTPAAGAPPRHLTVLNLATGEMQSDTQSVTLTGATTVGDTLVIMTSSEPVEERSDISIVFNEPIAVDSSLAQADLDATLQQLFKLDRNVASAGASAPNWVEVGATSFTVDSSARRVILHASLQGGIDYRVRLLGGISDTASPAMKLAQFGSQPPVSEVDLFFSVKKPKGEVASGAVAGTVRDLALDGNLLLVSAQEGGILAYDASDAARIDAASPFAIAQAFPDGVGQSWSVFVDHHGRVWNTALTSMYGVVRSYRTEKFAEKLDAASGTSKLVDFYGSGLVSWREGATSGYDTGLETTILSDRPEATPRKMQITVQDDSVEAIADASFLTSAAAFPVNAVVLPSGTSGEFSLYAIKVKTLDGKAAPNPVGFQYLSQRITIRNLTLGLRWSQDGAAGPAAPAGGTELTFANVLARPGDRIRIDRNLNTYGIVSLFGYGVGIYDLNALESNSRFAQWSGSPVIYNRLGTQIGLTQGLALTNGAPALTFSPDAIITASMATDPSNGQSTASLTGFALVPTKGLEIVTASHGSGTLEVTGDAGATAGAINDFTDAAQYPDLDKVRKLVTAAKGVFVARFNSAATYVVGKTTYALVSGGQYGLLIFDITTGYPALADVIWAPKGVWAVRTIGGRWATAVDGDGRPLLIDLSRIDERSLAKVPPCSGCDPLFPTLASSLESGSVPGDAYAFGSDDPRITWRGETPAATSGLTGTTLAPVGDPDSGFMFNGALLSNVLRVMSAIDPHVAVRVNLGNGTLSETSSIVPLGVPLPPNVAAARNAKPACGTAGADVAQPTDCRENVSLGAFRVEMTLPGSVSNGAAGQSLSIAIESERVPGALTEQTQKPLPPAHLRMHRATSSPAETNQHPITLTRVLPPSTNTQYRLQKGYNLFVSPWIVAIADPRASSAYEWGSTDREDAGCMSCTFPPFLDPHTSGRTLNTDFFEIYTNGRYLTVRPDRTSDGGSSVFAGIPNYAYLGDANRVFARLSTVMADTVRPPKALVAANGAPVATGQVLDTVYLHSGEVESSSVDFDAGGRAGWNVVFDRVYRSRTVGTTPFGFGWDSGIFKRLRTLPTGDVEYRDGSGEEWLYRLNAATSAYDTPSGATQKLVHTERGWTLIDQKRRIAFFDELGRVTAETDEFFTPDGKGNVIRYIYDANGRLAAVVDPNDRKSTITYSADAAHEGFVNTITDWRTSPRVISYAFDTSNRLTGVTMPSFTNSSGTILPKRSYAYTSASGTYADQLELSTNLLSVKEPFENANNGSPRVTYEYGTGTPRDYVDKQTWGANGEQVTFGYPSATQTVVLDALQQRRVYDLQLPPAPAAGSKLDWYSTDRAHVSTMTEESIAVAAGTYGQLPASTPAASDTPATTVTSRVFHYTWKPDGTPETIAIDGGPSTTLGYQQIAGGFGSVVSNITTSGAGTPLATTIHYRNASSALVDSVEVNGKKLEQHEPDRNLTTSADNNSVNSSSVFDAATGLLKSAFSQCAGVAQCTSTSQGSTLTVNYPSSQPNDKYRRGLPDSVVEGATDSVTTKLSYPDEDTTVSEDARGVVTTTKHDSWNRPVTVDVAGPAQHLHEEFEYDANSRVHIHRRTQNGETVTTTFTWDILGRQTQVTTDHIAADGQQNTTVTVSDDYSHFASDHTITHTGASSAVTTSKVDSLGRVISSSTAPGGGQSPVVSVTAYDIAGNPVYQSDTNTVAAVAAYDAAGRQTDAKLNDGTASNISYDGFGHPEVVKQIDNTGHVYSTRTTTYQADGQVLSTSFTGDGGARSTSRVWDGGGRTSGVAMTGGDQPVAVQQQFDDAGRIRAERRGTGTAATVSPVTETTFEEYGGSYLAPKITNAESGGKYETRLSAFDTFGNPQSVTVGPLDWQQQFDEAGHLTHAKAPNRHESIFSVDARGAVMTHTLPDGNTQSHDYDRTGTPKLFTDPTTEKTQTTVDLLGRPLVVTYPDTTTEEIRYEGARVAATKDRENRWKSFVYENGHLTQIWATQNGPSALLSDQLEQIDYDAAARVKARTTPDTRTELSDFTLDGLPRKTVQIRYRNGMGLQHPADADILDRYEQTHEYNGAGQRTSYTLPAGANGFASKVTQHYDALGNLTTLTTDTALSVTSTYRNSSRPITRSISLQSASGTPKILTRRYDYHAATGQLNELKATIDDPSTGASTVVGGSHVFYDGLQINDAQLLGISGGTRHTQYSYDERSRVAGSLTGTNAGTPPAPATPQAMAAGSALETPDAADFRGAQLRQALLDAPTKTLLESLHFDTERIDPPAANFASAGAGHKIASVTRGNTQRLLGYDGSKVTDDGLFVYHYDRQGRLDWTAEKGNLTGAVIRRVVYAMDAAGRIAGRTAQWATVPSVPPPYGDLNWQTETRTDVLTRDGLPAETTWLWDPVSDRLVAVMRAGASFNASDPNGNVVRQFIHGDMGYDDPLEVTAFNASTSKVDHLYPIFNEAAGGELQAVINGNGELVARSINTDPYGSAEFDINGAAVDQVSISAKKTSTGAVDSVTIRMRSTEQISASTVASGVRLAVVDGAGTVLRTSATAPALDTNDPFTIVWTVPGSEWSSLTDSAPVTVNGTSHTPSALSIAAKSTLRAAVWSASVPFQPPPDWAKATKPVTSSPALPFEDRESLTSVTSFVTSLASGATDTRTVYDIPSLSLIGTTTTSPYIRTLFASTFQAHPFAEPMNGKNYVRGRWYDPVTGTWLTPDPTGYRDSSNLYAYAGGDPVNGRDPQGLAEKKRCSDSTCQVVEAMVDTLVTTPAKSVGPAVDALIDFFDNTLLMAVTGNRKRVEKFNRQVTALSMLPSNVVNNASRRVVQTSQALRHPIQTASELSDEISPDEAKRIVARSSGSTAVIATIFTGIGEVRSIETPAVIPAPAMESTERLPAGIRFEGKVYRFVNPEYADGVWELNEYNMAAEHRYSTGGRGAIYASTSVDGVAAEAAHYGRTLSNAMTVGMKVSVNNILDLTNPVVRQEMGVTLEQLTGSDYTITQAIGDFARTRYNGLLVPSATDAGAKHLVLFKAP